MSSDERAELERLRREQAEIFRVLVSLGTMGVRAEGDALPTLPERVLVFARELEVARAELVAARAADAALAQVAEGLAAVQAARLALLPPGARKRGVTHETVE